MNLDELLNHDLLKLPKNWKKLGYDSYYECVVQEGSKFLKLLNDLDDTIDFGNNELLGNLSKEYLFDIVSKFYKVVIKTLQSYLNDGNPYKAYSDFNEILSTKDEKSESKQLFFFLDFQHLYNQQYRLRVKNGVAGLSDLFHVPFELRQKLNTFRYSIPGYPTLYFSNSIYLAYKEMNNPDYDNLYVSKFYHTGFYNNNETLLDMTTSPNSDSTESKLKYVARWILTMACSIKVGHPDEPFKAEYILPQIILQWVKSNIKIGSRKVIGVCYSSSKIDIKNDNFQGFFYNTAIPINSSGKAGFCNVRSNQLTLTKPIHFNEALKVKREIKQQGQVKSIELNGVKVEYKKTDFGIIEQVLSEKPYSELFHVNGKKLK